MDAGFVTNPAFSPMAENLYSVREGQTVSYTTQNFDLWHRLVVQNNSIINWHMIENTFSLAED